MLEGWFPGSDDRLRQPPDEVGAGRQLHPVFTDQLEQWLAQGAVLFEERPRVRAASIHWELRCAGAEELDPQPPVGGAGEAAQGSLGSADPPLRSRGHLTTVIGQYHAWGVVPLWRRPLRLCEMTTDRAPWAGTVTAPMLLLLEEIQCRVALAIGKSNFSWPPARLLPMLPNEGTKIFVSCFFLRQVPRKLSFLI
jgi:hypothetical protein